VNSASSAHSKTAENPVKVALLRVMAPPVGGMNGAQLPTRQAKRPDPIGPDL
jgi:hypothetical protein